MGKLKDWLPPQPWSVKLTVRAVITIIVLVISFPYLQMFINDFSSLLSQDIVVEQYDTVKLDLIIWRSNEWKGYDEDNPDLSYQNTYFGVVPKNDGSLESPGGLILGIYNRLLGKPEGYDSGVYWISRCRDHDNDGTDDYTGDPALSYGNNLSVYYNTDLMVRFKIRELVKGGVKRPVVRDIEVSPQTGDNSTTFRFKAWYFHEDETKLPKYMKIRINSSVFNMVQNEPLDTNPIDGISYNYHIKFELGQYEYQIIVSDGTFKIESEKAVLQVI